MRTARGPDRTPTGPGGDNAGGDGPSTRDPGGCRAPRTPRVHNSNRWGRTGTARGGPQMPADRSRSTRWLCAGTRSSRWSWCRWCRCRWGKCRWCRCRWLVRARSHRREQPLHGVVEFDERAFASASMGAEQVQPRWKIVATQDLAESTPEPVALHGGTGGATDRECHAWRNQSRIVDERAPERVDPHAGAFAPKANEGVALADPVDQADRRARPLARRDLSTARPARVLMRARKPCLRARRRLLG